MDKIFKIRDRVIATSDYENAFINGKIGTVVNFSINGYSVGVEFDDVVETKSGLMGHNCHGKAKSEHGWFVDENFLKHAKADSEYF